MGAVEVIVPAQFGLNMPHAASNPKVWVLGGVAFLLFLVVSFLMVSVALRRYLSRGSTEKDEFAPKIPPSENSSAFLTASMQAVITRLHEQERELARLHQAEKERAQQTERVSEAVTRYMPTGLLLIGASRLITYANPAATHVLGVKTLQYRRYNEALGENSPLAKLIQTCLEEGKTFQREQVEHAPPEGDVRQLGVTISPVYDMRTTPSGRISGALCLLSDLTELMALQKQVRLKESLASLGELSAGIAHEFKNSLATISGYAQLLRNEPLGPELRDSVDRIFSETRALSHIVTEFLQFARPLDLHSGTVNLQLLIERIVNEMRDAWPAVTFVVTGQFGEISGDETLLRQAFQNLMRNAAESCGSIADGGEVTITGGIEEAGGKPWHHLYVEDNGPGIPLAELDKLFLPFHTTKAGGTGLGLAVVQKIIVHHGGVVAGRNSARGGAEFVVSLPMR